MASAIRKILLKKGINAAGKSGLEFFFDERDKLYFRNQLRFQLLCKSLVDYIFSATPRLGILCPKTKFMMIRKEVIEIIMYYKEHKMLYNSRLVLQQIPDERFRYKSM